MVLDSHEKLVQSSVEDLRSLRVLTEVRHLQAAMDEAGNLPADVVAAVTQNRSTMLSEMSMPYFVTTTEHEVDQVEVAGEVTKVIRWLGRTAIEVATSGYDYHFSPEAHRRVDIEVAEAREAADMLKPGRAQVFISPKMTCQDASPSVAKAEHLHDDDAVRVSTAITDESGRVVGRRLESLLVRDIPISAWASMLKDENNIFKRSFTLKDEISAISVMELFQELDLPEASLPEGPVSLVAAVLPYITSEASKESVKYQLSRFRVGQDRYKEHAEKGAERWVDFDIEVARSLIRGELSSTLRQFMLVQPWNSAAAEVISRHELGDTRYLMTDELAVLLTSAQQKIMTDTVSVLTDNNLALVDIDKTVVRRITNLHNQIETAIQAGAEREFIVSLQNQQNMMILSQNIRSGGGCAGGNSKMFGDVSVENIGQPSEQESLREGGKESWAWKRGVCQVKVCPSPKPTEVGPCSICRHCQAEFDAGRDPTKLSFSPVDNRERETDDFNIMATIGKGIFSLGMKVTKEQPKGQSALELKVA